MICLILGCIAFGLFVLYDWNESNHRYPVFRPLFFLGCLFLLAGTIIPIFYAEYTYFVELWVRIIGVVFGILFLALLIYTLFFALPFDATYRIPASGIKPVYDRGVYALCRHPGVLWQFGLYLCIWLAAGGWVMFAACILYTVLNVIYVILEDRFFFPKQFKDYAEYRKTTPFLIPRIQSIRQCVKTIF